MPRKKQESTPSVEEQNGSPASKKGKKELAELEVVRITTEKVTFHVVGLTPLVCNSMSAKAKQQLLSPPRRKTKSERESTLKHEPLEEYRASPYIDNATDGPTRILGRAAWFKCAMAKAALRLPGVNKTEIGQLCRAEGFMLPIWGIPQLWMEVVRSADMNHTPDIRTRALIEDWAGVVTVSYVTPNLRMQPVVNLMANAGILMGVGDGRPEKGALNFGQFEIVAPEDERFQRILQTGGRDAQDRALENPTCWDAESETLFEWWKVEASRRGFEVA